MKKFILRFLLVLLSTLLSLFLFVICVCLIIFHGPSEKACSLLTHSCKETSALKFVPDLFLSAEKEESILNPDHSQDFVAYSTYKEGTTVVTSDTSSAGTSTDVYEFVDVKGSTYKGKLLMIHDPSKVMFAAVDTFGGSGYYIADFIEKYNAVGGTNAGGFDDPGGHGTGGIPDGLVIRDGELAYGELNTSYIDIVGFDSDHVLHVLNGTAQEALDLGIVNGVSFSGGPVLIQDGKRCQTETGGLNPRTCIGQTADGTILIASIEGRHPDSLGANYEDLIDLMESYGAVNAANLDGGSSTVMYYKGEDMIRSCSVIGERRLCTALLFFE